MRIAVIGATGLVGRKMLEVLEERGFPVTELIPAGSQRSVGKELSLNGQTYKAVTVEDAIALKPDIALFSAGSDPSRKYAPQFAANGTYVIDNSSAWRMEPGVPLVVPEVNSSDINRETRIIANPNCSTIQMVVALAPIHLKWKIKRLVISTYQSITGTGKDAVVQYDGERNGEDPDRVYPHQIFENCLPHCDIFLDNDYTKEEMKLVHETRKIMHTPGLAITATAVRVPVKGGHSESVNLELHNSASVGDLKELLRRSPGVVVQDSPGSNVYPMPLTAHEKDAVFVGRLRADESQPNTFNMWIVSDNLRKGAATNAVQIAEYLVASEFVGEEAMAAER